MTWQRLLLKENLIEKEAALRFTVLWIMGAIIIGARNRSQRATVV